MACWDCLAYVWWIRWKAFPVLSNTNYPSVKLVDCCKNTLESAFQATSQWRTPSAPASATVVFPWPEILRLPFLKHRISSFMFLFPWHFLWRWYVLPLRVRRIYIKTLLRPEASDSICFQYIGFYLLDNSVFWNRPSLSFSWTVTIISSRDVILTTTWMTFYVRKSPNFPRSNKRAEDSTTVCIFQCPLVTLTFFGEISLNCQNPFLLETQLSHCLTQDVGPSVNV